METNGVICYSIHPSNLAHSWKECTKRRLDMEEARSLDQDQWDRGPKSLPGKSCGQVSKFSNDWFLSITNLITLFQLTLFIHPHRRRSIGNKGTDDKLSTGPPSQRIGRHSRNLYKAVPRFGEFCSCCCLPLLPQLACSILATWELLSPWG